MKFLLWGLIVAAVIVWVLRAKKTLTKAQSARRDAARNTDANADANADAQAEAMVQCAQCGIHLPGSEALPGPAGRAYCSEEHRRLDGGS